MEFVTILFIRTYVFFYLIATKSGTMQIPQYDINMCFSLSVANSEVLLFVS